MTLLLDNTDNFRMLRREFFQILTSHFSDADEAINFIKKYSPHTSAVVKKATEEIKGQYDYTRVEKGLLFISLMFSFIFGSAFYGLDVGADFGLLIQSGKCNMSQSDTNISHVPENVTFGTLPPYLNDSSLKQNDTLQTDFNCTLTLGAVPQYWEFTFLAILIPFLLNACLVVIECYRNGWDSMIMLPYMFTKYYRSSEDNPFVEMDIKKDIKDCHTRIICCFFCPFRPFVPGLAWI